ncbi:MAG: hypothetical protein ACFCUN_07860 [Hyphomicrobiaceae bacterium]
MLIARLLAALLLLAPITRAGHAGETAAECYSDWSQASQVVAREQLASIDVLATAAKATEGAELVTTVLCQMSGAYVYRIVLREPGGRLRTATVNARRPFGVEPK